MCKKLILLTSFVLVLSLVSSNAVFAGIVIEIGIYEENDAVEEEQSGNMYMTSSDLELPEDGGDIQVIGLRFLNVEIDRGAKIINAYVEFTADDVEEDEPVNLIIDGELVPDAPTFADINNNVSDRTRTTAKVEWQPEHWAAENTKHQTSDISAVIQDIIDQEGWSSGNALVIIISDNPDNPSTGRREAASGIGSRAPLLHIEFSVPYATQPSPADGALLDDTWVNLMWEPGISAVSHDVYLSDNLADVEAGAESAFQGNQASATFIAGFPGMPYPEGLVLGTTYYWRIDEVEADDTKIAGDVWSFTVPSKKAYNPSPPDGSKNIDSDVQLSWTVGHGSKLHTVYFGDNFDEVSNAAGGVAQIAATYTPGTLERDKTYYWRVDEFDVIETHKGDVWSFKTLPIIAITDPNLIGYWKFDETSGDTVIDFSGYGNDGELGGTPVRVEGILGGAVDLTGDDYVVIDGVVDDITSNDITLSAWIKTRQPGEGNVFASNTGSSHVLQFGIDNGNVWVDDGPDVDFPPAVNDDQWHMITMVMKGSRITVYTDGVQVGTISTSIDITTETRWSIGQEWDSGGSVPSDFYVGIVDEVRFYDSALTADQVQELLRGDPLAAWNPNPNNKSTVDIIAARKPLSWSAGDEAAEHDVYFGTDKDTVSNADASDTTGIYQGRQGGTSLTLPADSVEWGGGPYYWRVDENNNDGSITTGSTWSFSVADYLIV
ncbi:MAG: LamG domain-containing protein, partial [Planctomycetota bacterium]